MEDALRIAEIFHSIQGESTRAGLPCSFIRLAGCNLDCAYCDTRYARDAGEGRLVPPPLIVAALRPHKTALAEITGGEPLLQPATPTLARLLLREGYTVLVETNGSLDISPLPFPVIRIMDFKAPSSGMAGRNRMENLAHIRAGDEIKFVLADRTDYEWARAIIRDGDYPAAAVSLFSSVAGRLAPATLAGWMLDDRLPARLNLQLHKFIWPGIEQGV